MQGHRKIIVRIATSADGYIARPDGDFDWLDRPRTAGDYGLSAFYRSIDTILWGRKTYEVALEFQKKGIKGTEFDTTVRNCVFSRGRLKQTVPGVELVKEPIPIFAKHLRTMPGKNIWVMGGAGIIGSFLDERQIYEFIIDLIP